MFRLFVSLAFGFCLSAPSFAQDKPLRIATFEVDVTPPIGTPLCDGLVIPAKEIVDPLTARGLVIFSEGKPIGVICHGPWTLVEADLVRGRTLTSWPSLQTDIRNAGGNWVDEEVVSDGQLTSSRKPDDLPAFCARIVEEFTRGARELESVTSSNGGAAASAR